MLFDQPSHLGQAWLQCKSNQAWRKVQPASDSLVFQMIATSEYEVHYNSNRLGIRLSGPKPQFARTDGGEGGAHPSNVHDHVYPLGTINFTGDMPVILCADGPSLGGFVCPATTILVRKSACPVCSLLRDAKQSTMYVSVFRSKSIAVPTGLCLSRCLCLACHAPLSLLPGLCLRVSMCVRVCVQAAVSMLVLCSLSNCKCRMFHTEHVRTCFETPV